MRALWRVAAVGLCGLVGVGVAAAQQASALPASGLPATTEARIDKVVACLPPPVVVKGEAMQCTTLAAEMAKTHVPGVSIAVVHDGKIEWAQGFGVAAVGGSPVDAETMFQAGSISKPVASMAVLKLVEQGKLKLDADVNTELTGWKLPESAAEAGVPVTLRELMTHTAGTTVHGFPGYAQGAAVPTLEQVLDGVKPANTPAIRVETKPGTRWNYSGGGITVMQEMAIDAAKEPFATLVHDTVLAPMGMTRSTFEQPLPAAMQADAATPYDGHGAAVPGGAHTYVALAAAGLWTTPTDLAKYVMEVQRSLDGKANHVLSEAMTKEMLTPGMGSWGLGVEIGGAQERWYFEHGGVNAGFEALFVGYEQGGDGAVVMTNAQGGSRVAEEVMSSIAQVYGWPDFRPVERTEVKVDPAILQRYVGTYQIAPTFSLTFTVENGHLMGQATGQQKVEQYPESETRFFVKVANAETQFVVDDKGQATSLVVYQGGREIKGVKR